MLVDGDVIADLVAFSDHAEAVVEEEALTDLRAGMNVDPGQEAREMVDQAREEEQPSLPQPMRCPVKRQRGDAGIEENVPARPRGGITGLDRIQIGNEA